MLPFPSKRNALERLKAAGMQVGTVLDVGAHEQTLELRQAFPDLKHVLFEPAEEFRPKLEANYAGMDFEIVPFAVSSSDAVGYLKKFSIDGGGVSHTTLVNSDLASDAEQVATVRLDTVVRRGSYRRPFLLKVDIDGYEIPALEGAAGIWDDIACIVVEATRESFVERVNFLSSRGFQLYDIVDLCYYYDVFSQADLIFIPPSVAQADAFRPWETRKFSWSEWISVADFETHIPNTDE